MEVDTEDTEAVVTQADMAVVAVVADTPKSSKYEFHFSFQLLWVFYIEIFHTA